MIGDRLAELPYRIIITVVVAVFLVGGALYLAAGTGGGDIGEGDEAPMHVEEFQVAEPLDLESPVREPWETITAVTEPYDDVEAAMSDGSKRIASDDEELALQCQTVLKELAFCTSEDSFLDIIGTSPNLQTGGERERFMERVQHWFEPGGTRGDCQLFLTVEEMTNRPAKRIFARTAQATSMLCDDFGELLLESEALVMLGLFWMEQDEQWD